MPYIPLISVPVHLHKYIQTYKSALLFKLMSALRAGDADPAFSSWDPDFLSAGRTFVNMIVLALHNPVLYLRQLRADPSGHLQIFLVLGTSLTVILRKHPEVADAQQDQCHQIQSLYPCECIRQQAEQCSAQYKAAQLIRAISSIHEFHKPSFHSFSLVPFLIIVKL
jgi:hypothetical protein